MFPLKNTEAYIHANGYRSTLGKELAARDADISELGSEIQALTNEVRGNWATGGVNLFDPSEAVVGYVRDTDGTVNQLSGYNSTGFIPVVAGSRYTVTSLQTGAKWGAWYNSSKQYISGISGYDDLVAPSNAAYVRLTINNNDNPNWATTTQIEKGATATPYQPYAKTNVELTQDVAEIKNGLELSGYFTGNIDTINNQYGYMYSVDKSKASGTYPTGSGSVFLLMGFSAINSSDNVVYGVQIALSFTTSTIHIRHFDYTAGGGTWGAWSQIS